MQISKSVQKFIFAKRCMWPACSRAEKQTTRCSKTLSPTIRSWDVDRIEEPISAAPKTNAFRSETRTLVLLSDPVQWSNAMLGNIFEQLGNFRIVWHSKQLVPSGGSARHWSEPIRQAATTIKPNRIFAENSEKRQQTDNFMFKARNLRHGLHNHSCEKLPHGKSLRRSLGWVWHGCRFQNWWPHSASTSPSKGVDFLEFVWDCRIGQMRARSDARTALSLLRENARKYTPRLFWRTTSSKCQHNNNNTQQG